MLRLARHFFTILIMQFSLKITSYLLILFFIIFIDRAAPTCVQAVNLSVENCSVPIGGTLTMMVNISVDNQKANYLYLDRGSSVTRLIKLREGEDGCGNCYYKVPRCKENYCLRHAGDKILNITLKEVTKSMEGFYRLYPYCLGPNHNCTTHQPLKSFMLYTKDNPEPTKVTKTDSGPTEWISSGGTDDVVITGAVSAAIIVPILMVWFMV